MVTGTKISQMDSVASLAAGDVAPIVRGTLNYKFDLGTKIASMDSLKANLSDLAASSGSALVGFLPSGAGAVSRTVQAKMRESVYLTDFGAVGGDSAENVSANDTAIAAAIAALSAGGELIIPKGIFRYSVTPRVTTGNFRLVGQGCDTSILKPVGWIDGWQFAESIYPSSSVNTYGVTVEGVGFDGSLQSAGANDTYGNGLNFNGFDRIKVRNCDFNAIKQQTLVSTFYQIAGSLQTGVQIQNNTFRNSGVSKICVGIEGAGSAAIITGNEMFEIGGNAIELSYNGGSYTTNGRTVIANNVIKSVAAGGGFGVRVSDNMYDVLIANNLIYGFDVGIRTSSNAASTFDYLIQGNKCREWRSGGIYAFPMNSTDNTETLISGNHVRSSVASGSSYGILAAKGATISGNKVRSGNTGIAVTGGGQKILGNDITGPTVAVDTSSGTGVYGGGNFYDGTLSLSSDTVWTPMSGRGAAIASASAITLPAQGDVFSITGTTNITAMTTGAGNAGRRVTLIFAGALTFTDGANLTLAGNFVTTADDTITLVCDGTNWIEVSRSVN